MQTYDKTKYRRLSSKDKVRVGDYYWSFDLPEFKPNCTVKEGDNFDVGYSATWNPYIYYYRERKEVT